ASVPGGCSSPGPAVCPGGVAMCSASCPTGGCPPAGPTGQEVHRLPSGMPAASWPMQGPTATAPVAIRTAAFSSRYCARCWQVARSLRPATTPWPVSVNWMRRHSRPDLRPEMWAAPLVMGGGVARVRCTLADALLAQSLGQQPIQRVGEGLLVLVTVGCRAAATGQTGAVQLVHQIAYRQSLADAAAVIDFAAPVDGG